VKFDNPRDVTLYKQHFHFRKPWRTPSSVYQKGIIKRDKFRTKTVGLTLLAFLWLYDWSISPFICSFALSIFLSHIRIFSSVELNLRLKTLNYWTAYSPRMFTYIYRRTISNTSFDICSFVRERSLQKARCRNEWRK